MRSTGEYRRRVEGRGVTWLSVDMVSLAALEPLRSREVSLAWGRGDIEMGIQISYRVSHDTGHPEIWLSPRPFMKSGT